MVKFASVIVRLIRCPAVPVKTKLMFCPGILTLAVTGDPDVSVP